MNVLLQLIFGFLMLLCLAQLAGLLLTGRKSIHPEAMTSLVFTQILGMVFLVAVYAAYKSGFKTIMLTALPLVVYLSVYIRKNGIKQALSKNDVVPLFVFALAAVLLTYLMIRGSEFDGMKVPVKDQASYAVIVSGLNQYGVESFTSYLYPFDTGMKASPYHYLELWLAALISTICGFNAVLSLSGVATAYILFCLFCSLYPLMKPASSKTWIKLSAVISAILFLAHRGFLHYYSDTAQYWDSIFFDGNFKFIFLLPLFVLVLERLLNGSVKETVILLLLLPVFNMVLLPVVLPVSLLFLAVSAYLERKTYKHFSDLAVLLPIFIYLIMLANHLFLVSSRGMMSVVSSIGGIAYNILYNGLDWILINSLLLLFSGILLFVNGGRKFAPAVLLILMLTLNALLVRAVFDTNQNSFQIFTSTAFLAVFGLTLVLLRGFLLLFPKRAGLIYMFYFVFSIGMAVESYPSVQHVFSPRISAYSQPYLDSVAMCSIANPIGIRFVNGSTRTNLMKNPAYAGISDYFPLTSTLQSTVVLNLEELFPPETDHSHHAESLRREFLQYSVFIKKMNFNPFNSDTAQLHRQVRLFVDRYKPQFCIVEKDRVLPAYLMQEVYRKIYDPFSRETFYILKRR